MDLIVRGESTYVATGGKTLDPDKETVVFVHGVGQDHTIWVLPIRYFARHGRNVLALDLPGHGRSAGPPLASIEEMADWVVEVLQAAHLADAAVVGHSMGSLVALDAAARHPDRVRAIAMVGVSFPLTVADVLLESAAADSHEAIDMLTFWSHSNDGQLGGSPTPGLWMAGRTMKLLERAAPGLIESDLRACDSYGAGEERAGMVHCPALLILGAKDRMTPVRGANALVEKLTDARTVIYAGAGHPLLSERSDPVLDELIEIV